MPPRVAPGRGQTPQRGGRGSRGAGRATGARRGGIAVGERETIYGPSIADVKVVGMKRPGFGTGGTKIRTVMNSYETSIPGKIIYQYDAVHPDTLKFPARVNREIMDKLQTEIAPTVFALPTLFDGRAILYANHRLPLGETDSREFNVPLGKGSRDGTRPPKIYKVKITKVGAENNPETLSQFLDGRYSYDPSVQAVEMAMNTAIRMVPYLKYICRGRSFYSPEGKRSIGGGLEVWRGYFQSVRPSIGRMLLNLDISSTVMYADGPLIGLCLSFFGINNVAALSPDRGFTKEKRNQLEKFLSGVRFKTKHTGKERFFGFRKLSLVGASKFKFDHDTLGEITLKDYYKTTYSIVLKHPDIVCVQAGKRDVIPLELCEVMPGQFAKIEISPEQKTSVVEFSTMHPQQRFEAIQRGFDALGYAQSDYLRQLEMTISPTKIELDGRVLGPPTLKCNPTGRENTIRPRNGQWNMLGKKYFRPARISGFVVLIFQNQRQFDDTTAKRMVTDFVKAARDFGVVVDDDNPIVKWVEGRPNIDTLLRNIGRAHIEKRKKETGQKSPPPPSLIIAAIPPSSADLYNAIKRFGDITMGVATQCLLANKCKRANHQYWANVMLKVNVKLDGINFVPDLDIKDPANPTIIMGADTIHPPPGSEGRPSFTALVSSVDSTFSKYIASSRVQKGRVEIIADMEEMCLHAFEKWELYQKHVEKQQKSPTRLFFFRDGVSEGEFQQVLDQELPLIEKACRKKKINPKITFVVVGKRHHHRGKPADPRQGDAKSGNLPAGTTIDTGIVHPLQFDYYQYTHGGLLGTSRPSHYTILRNDNGLSADGLQALSFGLAHAYARSTRSVSIPAPVYYADIVCSRKAIHFDPSAQFSSDAGSQVSGKAETDIAAFKAAFSPLHAAQSGLMYYM